MIHNLQLKWRRQGWACMEIANLLGSTFECRDLIIIKMRDSKLFPKCACKDEFAPPPSLLKTKSLQTPPRLAKLAFATLSPLLPVNSHPSLHESPESGSHLLLGPFLIMAVMSSHPPEARAAPLTVPWETAAQCLHSPASLASGQSLRLVLTNDLFVVRMSITWLELFFLFIH